MNLAEIIEELKSWFRKPVWTPEAIAVTREQNREDMIRAETCGRELDKVSADTIEHDRIYNAGVQAERRRRAIEKGQYVSDEPVEETDKSYFGEEEYDRIFAEGVNFQRRFRKKP